MRRFEFVEGTSSKFWEAEVSGNILKVCYGKIGTAGKAETKVLGSEVAAQAEADKLIREKTKKGYKEVAAAAPKAGGGAELEQAIWDNPEDDTVWQVYADWLLQQGNPLGEHISLSIAGKSQPAAKKAANKLLEKNGKKWLGKLFEQEYVSLEWHNGMLKSARLAMEYEGEPDVATLLRATLSLEIAKFLNSLNIGIAMDDDGQGDFTDCGQALIKGGIRRGLKKLHFGDFESDDCEVSWTTLPDIAPFATVLPDLETLIVKGGSFGLGPSSWPKLSSFTIITGGLPSLKGINQAKWPKLEALEIWFGRSYYGCNTTTDEINTLLHRKDMPQLKHLGLVNHEFNDVVMELVLNSPLLPQLQSLDLSKASLGDESGELILANLDKLKHLKKLDLSQNFITPAMGKRLDAALGYPVGKQRVLDNWDDGRRYCVLGE